MALKMINDKVLIKPKEIPSETESGIILPDVTKEKPEEGVVISVGEGTVKGGKVVPLLVKEGDRVMFSKWAGTEIKVKGEVFVMVKEIDIFGVLS